LRAKAADILPQDGHIKPLSRYLSAKLPKFEHPVWQLLLKAVIYEAILLNGEPNQG